MPMCQHHENESHPVNFRPGHASDEHRCAEIWMSATAARDGTARDPKVRDRARAKLLGKDSILYVAGCGSEAQGFGLVIDESSTCEARRAHLSLLAVDPMSQGSGLGRYLIHAISDALAGDGFDKMTLNVLQDNTTARSIYEGAGWQVSGQGEFKDSGRPFVSYMLLLSTRRAYSPRSLISSGSQ